MAMFIIAKIWNRRKKKINAVFIENLEISEIYCFIVTIIVRHLQ